MKLLYASETSSKERIHVDVRETNLSSSNTPGSMTINIDGRSIGEGEPCFIVAEIGVNHNGDISLAKQLVDSAKECGVDAVKFQAFKAERITTRHASQAEYQLRNTGRIESQFDLLKKLELSDEEIIEIYRYSVERGITCFFSAFDRESVDLLDQINVPAFKVASGELTNHYLLQQIATKNRPIIISSGMCTIEEISEALRVMNAKRENLEVMILHCVTSYPAKPSEMNLKVIETLRSAFHLPIGLSDHSLSLVIPAAAVGLGASIIEKHFTLDRGLSGPDHKASIEPHSMKEMVLFVREVESALGNGDKRPTREEERIKKVTRKSLVARRSIPRGTKITSEMLDTKRPGTGLSPSQIDLVVGKIVSRDIMADELLILDDLIL